MTTTVGSDERLHSEVGLKHERERTRQRTRTYEKTLRSGERLQRRTCTQLKRQLRTVESAADRLERLRMRREQLRTVDRESADDRLQRRQRQRYLSTIESPGGRQARTSATEKTTRGSG